MKSIDSIGFLLIAFCRDNDLKLEYEYRFHPTRRWRADFAIPEYKILIEYHGGIFMKKSGHSNLAGQMRDHEKMNEAQKLGWRVLTYNTKSYGNIIDDLSILIAA